MYYILYTDDNNKNHWEVVSGEDAMQQRVDELIDILDCYVEDIHVFSEDSEL